MLGWLYNLLYNLLYLSLLLLIVALLISTYSTLLLSKGILQGHTIWSPSIPVHLFLRILIVIVRNGVSYLLLAMLRSINTGSLHVVSILLREPSIALPYGLMLERCSIIAIITIQPHCGGGIG